MDAWEAIRNKDQDGLKAALAADPSVARTTNADGASLLSFALYMGNQDSAAVVRAALPEITPYEAILVGDMARVKAAIAGGWDANELSSDGFAAIALAAFFGRRELVDLLLPLTRDVNVRSQNRQRVAALHAAAASRDSATVEKLLRAGADPNLPQQDGFLPIHVAAQHGDAPMTALLLLFGASATQKNDTGKAAADHAREGGHAWLAARIEAFGHLPAG